MLFCNHMSQHFRGTKDLLPWQTCCAVARFDVCSMFTREAGTCPFMHWRLTTASHHMHLQPVLLWLFAIATLLKLGKCHCVCDCLDSVAASLSDCVLTPRHCLVCCSLRSAFVVAGFAVG